MQPSSCCAAEAVHRLLSSSHPISMGRKKHQGSTTLLTTGLPLRSGTGHRSPFCSTGGAQPVLLLCQQNIVLQEPAQLLPELTPMSRSCVGFPGAEDGTLPSLATKLSAQPLRKLPLQEPDLLVAVNARQIDGGSRTKPSPPAPTSAGFYPTTGLGVRAARTSHADVRIKTTWHWQLAQLLRAHPVQDHKSAP